MGKKPELWSTFRGNNDFPIYNWFYFTESYSRGLARNIILKYAPRSGLIVDPFSGTGTTILCAKELGYDVLGLDVSNLMVNVSKAKVTSYDLDLLKTQLQIFKEKMDKESIHKLSEGAKWIRQYFFKQNYDDLLIIRQNIDNLILEEYRPLFYLAMLRAMQIVSRAQKTGAMITKKKVDKVFDTYAIFYKTIEGYIKDLIKYYRKNPEFKSHNSLVVNTSVSNIKEYAQNAAAIICSPPYLNKTEYTRRMGLELALIGSKTILQNHLGAENIDYKYELYKTHFAREIEVLDNSNAYKTSQEDYNLHNYFIGLEKFVYDSYDCLQKEGILSVTIAGACFRNFALDITDYFKELVQKAGFTIVDIKIEREIQCHKDRTTKIGCVNEFTIVCKKL